MKNLVVLNKTDTPKYALLTGDQAFLDQGPEGTFFSDNTQKFGGTRQVISQEAFKAPTKLVKSGEMTPVDMEGQFVVEINGVAVPFIFNAEDLPDYFNDGEGNTTGLVFELVGDGEWIAGDWFMTSQVMGSTDAFVRPVTNANGWGIKLVAKDDTVLNQYKYANIPAIDKVTLGKVPFSLSFSSRTGNYIWLASGTDDNDRAYNTLYNLDSDFPVNITQGFNVVNRVNFFGADEDKMAVIDDWSQVIILKTTGNTATRTDGFSPDEGFVGGVTVTPDYNAVMVLTNKPLNNTRAITLSVLPIDENGVFTDNRTSYAVTGDLVGYESGFGGAEFDNDPIFITSTDVLLPFDGKLLLCKIDHVAKSVETIFLPPLQANANPTYLRDVSPGVAEILLIDNNFNYSVQRISASTITVTEVKGLTPLGTKVLSGFGGIGYLEDNRLLLNTYDDSGNFEPKVAIFDGANNVTFATITPPPVLV